MILQTDATLEPGTLIADIESGKTTEQRGRCGAWARTTRARCKRTAAGNFCWQHLALAAHDHEQREDLLKRRAR